MTYDILAAYYYTPPMPGLDPVQHALLLGEAGLCIVFVAIRTREGKWKCYAGLALNDQSETEQQQSAAANGVKVNQEVATAHFPKLNPKEFIY